jgi:hypothetical protein
VPGWIEAGVSRAAIDRSAAEWSTPCVDGHNRRTASNEESGVGANPTPIPLRVAAAALGGGLLGIGVVAVFVSSNDVGSAALLAAGAALVVIGYAGDRIRRFKAGSFEVELLVPAILARVAEAAKKSGNLELGEQLDAEAAEALARLGSFAESYDRIRASRPAGPRRTSMLDEQWEQARLDNLGRALTAEQVSELFRKGGDGQRRAALRAMYDDPTRFEFNDVVEAIQDSKSGDEQYRALYVMRKHVDRLNDDQKSRLLEILEAWREHVWIRQDPPRRVLINDILRKLGEAQPG